MAENQNTELKFPLILKVFSVSLILCPVGNFLISYYMSDIRNQMGLNQILEILPLIQPIDWAWNGLVAVSGALMLQRRKLSWLIAIISILFCTIINIYKFVAIPNVPFGWGYLLMTFTVSMAAVLMIWYFRYPYLDRRDRWLTLNRRAEVEIPAKVMGGPSGVFATNISATGARLRFPSSCDYIIGKVIKIELENHVVESQVIWVRDDTVGVTFLNPGREFKRWALKLG